MNETTNFKPVKNTNIETLYEPKYIISFKSFMTKSYIDKRVKEIMDELNNNGYAITFANEEVQVVYEPKMILRSDNE